MEFAFGINQYYLDNTPDRECYGFTSNPQIY